MNRSQEHCHLIITVISTFEKSSEILFSVVYVVFASVFTTFSGLNDRLQWVLYGFAGKDMIFLVRLLGWFLMIAAVLVASLEMLMALSTGTYICLATRDMWTLLAGVPPAFETRLAQWQETTSIPSKLGILLTQVGAIAMEIPAWTLVGFVGGFLVLTSRVHRLHHPGHYRRLFR